MPSEVIRPTEVQVVVKFFNAVCAPAYVAMSSGSITTEPMDKGCVFIDLCYNV